MHSCVLPLRSSHGHFRAKSHKVGAAGNTSSRFLAAVASLAVSFRAPLDPVLRQLGNLVSFRVIAFVAVRLDRRRLF